MARTIDVDRVKREIRKNKEKIVISCKRKYVPLSLIYKILNKAPTLTPPNEWISVEEGLPPDMGDVLVVAFWHERWQTMIGWCSDNGKKWRVYTSHGEREPGGVTHWMPLPAPPDRRPPEGEEGDVNRG